MGWDAMQQEWIACCNASHRILRPVVPAASHCIPSHPIHPCCTASDPVPLPASPVASRRIPCYAIPFPAIPAASHPFPSCFQSPLLHRIPCYAIPFPSIPAESHPIPTHRSQPSLLRRIASCPTLIHPCYIASHPVLLSSTPAAPCPTPCQPRRVASHPGSLLLPQIRSPRLRIQSVCIRHDIGWSNFSTFVGFWCRPTLLEVVQLRLALCAPVSFFAHICAHSSFQYTFQIILSEDFGIGS